MTRVPDDPMEAAILDLLSRRREGATICPSDAARAVAGPDEADWRPRMEAARDAARRLVGAGAVEITQRGSVVDLDGARGPIRIRLARQGEQPGETPSRRPGTSEGPEDVILRAFRVGE